MEKKRTLLWKFARSLAFAAVLACVAAGAARADKLFVDWEKFNELKLRAIDNPKYKVQKIKPEDQMVKARKACADIGVIEKFNPNDENPTVRFLAPLTPLGKSSGTIYDDNVVLGVILHETGGCSLTVKEKGGKGIGLWQFTFGDDQLPTYAKQLAAKDANDLLSRLKTDPLYSTRAGITLLDQKTTFSPWNLDATPSKPMIGALCGHGGAQTFWNASGHTVCNNIPHIEIYRSFYAGDKLYALAALPTTTNLDSSAPPADPSKPNVGDTVILDNSGKILGTTLNCADPTRTIAEGLDRMARQYGVRRMDTAQQTYNKTVAEITANGGINPLMGDIGDTYCLNDINLKIGDLRDLLDGTGSFIQKMINNTINSLANQVCNYVNTQIRTGMANLLDMVCIPMPGIPSFGLDLPGGLARKGCDGISIGNTLTRLQGGRSQAEADRIARIIAASGLEGAVPRVEGYFVSRPAQGLNLFGTMQNPIFITIPDNQP